MQRGAYDYLTKPFDNDEVRLLAERALSARALAREVVELRTGIQEVWEFGALVGKSPRMQEVYKTIGRVAGTDVTVLLRGESGTGKEVVARAHPPLQPAGGQALRGGLLRGHPGDPPRVRALRPRAGRLHRRRTSAASAGSSWRTAARSSSTRSATCRPELQAKLLRVLQERQLERVGGGEAIRVDVRVVAATNRDLEALIRDGTLPRGPLLPPERRHAHPARRSASGIEDVPFLVEHFLGKYGDRAGRARLSPPRPWTG